MTTTDWVGTFGVTILLIAFFLNLTKRISSDSILYIGLNLAGAGIALIASILLNYWPFIILEAVWTLVSLVSYVKYFRKKSDEL